MSKGVILALVVLDDKIETNKNHLYVLDCTNKTWYEGGR